MKNETKYYYIECLDVVGRKSDKGYEIYDKEEGWIPDKSSLIMDRLMGYDPTEDKDSPYAIGNSEIMGEIKEISKSEVTLLKNN